MDKWSDLYTINATVPVSVPDGESGDWKVYSYEVGEQDAKWDMVRAMVSTSYQGRHVPQGHYKALKRGTETIMSNTPDEIRDCYSFFRNAKGRVLVNGLGLGVVLEVILAKVDPGTGKPAVDEAVVVENSDDVIKLVGPTFSSNPRVRIVKGNALSFPAKKLGMFDAVWHDIWDNICSDNLEDMHKLHVKYGHRTKWQGSWCRERCELQRRRWR